eukprot:scaffold11438_cov129-Isochrysis_galbana.AAC.3
MVRQHVLRDHKVEREPLVNRPIEPLRLRITDGQVDPADQLRRQPVEGKPIAGKLDASGYILPVEHHARQHRRSALAKDVWADREPGRFVRADIEREPVRAVHGHRKPADDALPVVVGDDLPREAGQSHILDLEGGHARGGHINVQEVDVGVRVPPRSP